MILIVEDDRNTRELYVQLLGQVGIVSLATGDPELALSWARAKRFDAILIDLGLPRVRDGLHLVACLRALPNASPLIAATGHYLEPETLRLFTHALAKPIDAHTLVETVRRHVREQLPLPW